MTFSLTTFLENENQRSTLASATGYIGVGWAYKHETFDFVTPHEDGKYFNDSMHPVFNHQQRFAHEVLRKHPELRALISYTTLPRYRVYWKDKHNIVIGWPPLLEEPKFQAHLKELYKLVLPEFEGHEHYNGMEMGPDYELAQETLLAWK